MGLCSYTGIRCLVGGSFIPPHTCSIPIIPAAYPHHNTPAHHGHAHRTSPATDDPGHQRHQASGAPSYQDPTPHPAIFLHRRQTTTQCDHHSHHAPPGPAAQRRPGHHVTTSLHHPTSCATRPNAVPATAPVTTLNTTTKAQSSMTRLIQSQSIPRPPRSMGRGFSAPRRPGILSRPPLKEKLEP